MPIKTILLHMANDERHTARLDVSLKLARRFQAYLDVLYIATPVSMPAAVTGRGASYAYVAEATAIAHEKAEEIEHEIRQNCTDIAYSWTVQEGDHLELLARRSYYADIAIVTQSHPAHLEDRVRLHLPDHLPMHAACPTLVLPWEGPAKEPGRHILLAWNGKKEAARAIRDTMPFLKEADKVTVLTIESPHRKTDPAKDICTFLGRHGIRYEHRSNMHEDGGDAGEIILAVARDLGCDSVVMGAYGHSRLREMIAGGATRYILGHMDVPVFMSH